ncbi:50S ribosomal protein L11 methyltransferase [Arvimicrobium flavum]|uniref:50S ribosomal protein L11 methyltransferase n=1 Tax=Arvimicrobium flavum TaxID=3393320 RepID=UPI00237A26CD|nr:50S ribosomal protein L11 methyltransferase [Mesorhizobium shangrilense]
MPQTRLFLALKGADARRAFDALEQVFEEDGLPLLIHEIDEAGDLHEVSIYDPGGTHDIEERMQRTLREIGLPQDIDREILEDIDWVTKSLEGLKPVRAGRFLVHGAHDRDKRRIGDIGIEIEAGLAFGTGHHGTTAGCLDMLSRVMKRENPRNALDLGTGSAVLAIAVAKLARIPVLATDIDPVATRVAAENVALNGVTDLVRAVTAPGFHHPAFAASAPFDLIVANILARPLMGLAPDMSRHLSGGGSLILSGILDRQRDAVVSAYVGQRFRHVRTDHREGWVTIHLKR